MNEQRFRTGVWSVFAVCVSVLAGCGDMPKYGGMEILTRLAVPGVPPVGLKACDDPGIICTIKVMVDQKCVVSVDEPDVSVTARNVILAWKIISPGYEFPNNGGITGLSDPPFQPIGGPRDEIRLLDKHSPPKHPPPVPYMDIFKYAVKVQRKSDGTACPPLDPWIRNSF